MSTPYLPTPEDIAEACERIRAGWSATEERHRRLGAPPAAGLPLGEDTHGWTPPTFSRRDLFANVERPCSS